MYKNRIKIMIGVCALLLAVGLNMRHALNDYGVKSVNLNIEALASTIGDEGGITCNAQPTGAGQCWEAGCYCCSFSGMEKDKCTGNKCE